MDRESSIARKLDNSIHGVIAFIGTLFVTWGAYLVRPDRICRTVESDDIRRSQSFTLLAVSAFLYTIVVGPYLYQPVVETHSFMDGFPTFPSADDVMLSAYENVKNATVTSVLMHAMPLLLSIVLGGYFFAKIFVSNGIRFGLCIKVLVAGFAAQLFLLSAIHCAVLLLAVWIDFISLDPYFNAAYHLLYIYAMLIPWFAYIAFDNHVRNEKSVIYRKIPKYFAALVVILTIMAIQFQASRIQQFMESRLSPLESVTVSLHPQFELYRKLDAGHSELVVFFTMENNTDDYRLYDSSRSLLVIRDGIHGEPLFSKAARTLMSQQVRFIELPSRTTSSFSMHFVVSTKFSALDPYILPPWYGDDVSKELDLEVQLELTSHGDLDIVQSNKLESFTLRVVTLD